MNTGCETGSNSEPRNAVDDVGATDTAVFDAVAMVSARHFCQRQLVGVQHHVDPAVTDGMNGNLITEAVGVEHIAVEPFLRTSSSGPDCLRLGLRGTGW